MAIYLKKFETTSQYNAYTADTANFIKPNVSLTVDNNTVHYNPSIPPTPVETRVVAKFNVTDTSNPTPIGYTSYTNCFSEIEIDGIVQPIVVSAYTFSTTGEHIVKYTLKYLTTIGQYAFYNCTSLTSIDIPDSVTSISDNAFQGCTGLTSIDIPSGVTSIGNAAFQGCSSLSAITSYIMNAPSVVGGTFASVSNGGTLYVPKNSSGYDTWMNNQGNLGSRNWTKVEQ